MFFRKNFAVFLRVNQIIRKLISVTEKFGKMRKICSLNRICTGESRADAQAQSRQRGSWRSAARVAISGR
jgi:hypothetical protein